jgi:hypothetical protein
MGVLIVEDEHQMAQASRDGLRLAVIGADIPGDDDTDIATGVGYRIDTQPDTRPEGGDRG